MSEKEMDRAWYAAAKCQHVPMGACLTCIGASLAAAEERGRRAGIEERDELRARLWEALSVIESRAPDMTLLIPRIKVALAPRDSGHDAILCGPNCPGHAATVRK